ncbi:MAG: hypothetical protein L0H73_06195 [Nitrococcus sp.]|nr:hypothetical protein [Nitrococcus sp.]
MLRRSEFLSLQAKRLIELMQPERHAGGDVQSTAGALPHAGVFVAADER